MSISLARRIGRCIGRGRVKQWRLIGLIEPIWRLWTSFALPVHSNNNGCWLMSNNNNKHTQSISIVSSFTRSLMMMMHTMIGKKMVVNLSMFANEQMIGRLNSFVALLCGTD